jgi:hypothetical protein
LVLFSVFQFDNAASIQHPVLELDYPIETPVPVGSEIIIRRDLLGKVTLDRKYSEEVGFVFGHTDDGAYLVGLLKGSEVILVEEEMFMVSIRRYQGPTRAAPLPDDEEDEF